MLRLDIQPKRRHTKSESSNQPPHLSAGPAGLVTRISPVSPVTLHTNGDSSNAGWPRRKRTSSGAPCCVVGDAGRPPAVMMRSGTSDGTVLTMVFEAGSRSFACGNLMCRRDWMAVVKYKTFCRIPKSVYRKRELQNNANHTP
jgi:hypothetical protein